jgi:hypothetical protein
MRHEISIEGEARMERKYTSAYLCDYRGKKLNVICRECGLQKRCDVDALLANAWDHCMPKFRMDIARALKCPNVENICDGRLEIDPYRYASCLKSRRAGIFPLIHLVEDGQNFDPALRCPLQSVDDGQRGETIGLDPDGRLGPLDCIDNALFTSFARRKTHRNFGRRWLRCEGGIQHCEQALKNDPARNQHNYLL